MWPKRHVAHTKLFGICSPLKSLITVHGLKVLGFMRSTASMSLQRRVEDSLAVLCFGKMGCGAANAETAEACSIKIK